MSSSRPLATLLLTVLAACAWPAHAQETFPTRPITMLVPFGAGSGTDLITRLLSKSMQESLGVPVVVDNKPGANGAIGATTVARAKPDGYTLLVGSGTTNAANYALFPGKLGYTPESFETVSGISAGPISLYVPADSPWQSIADIQAASQQPGAALSCGSGNAVTQVACEMFRLQSGAQMVNVPYKANSAALTDVVGKQVSFAFSDAAASQALIDAGRLRPLAVAAAMRHAGYPDTPTFGEQGLQQFEFTGWVAVFAPAGTPAPVVEQLHRAVQTAIVSSEMQLFIKKTGGAATSMSLVESRQFVKDELVRWNRYVKESNVKPAL